jgi:hypothetical protein
MNHREKSYPGLHLREELSSLGVPEDKQDYGSLKNLLSSTFRSISFAGKDANELAEILIYLIRKKLIDSGKL